jgi:ABC-2 type transport system ATP-binding protein
MPLESKNCLFELTGVSKSFNQPMTNPFKKRLKVQALADVSLRIPKRKVTCLLGPNGAGKTTLIKILSSLITPDTGGILYDGVPYERWDRSVQGKIGLVTPNDRSFYWRLTGRQNLAFFGSLHSLKGKALKERVEESLSDSRLLEDADKPYRLYSSGMKQRLNIARALLGDPEIYLLDEPASHLDPLARADFWDFIERTLIGKRSATVFLCTHDLEEARRLADQVAILDKGRIVDALASSELGAAVAGRRQMEFRYDGVVPQAWLGRYASLVSMSEPGRLLISFDPSAVDRAQLIRGFVTEGGSLTQAYEAEADLLQLLERKVRGNA